MKTEEEIRDEFFFRAMNIIKYKLLLVYIYTRRWYSTTSSISHYLECIYKITNKFTNENIIAHYTPTPCWQQIRRVFIF